MFQVTFIDPSSGYPVKSMIKWVPETWSARTVGGPYSATIRGKEPTSSLEQGLVLLNHRVEITNPEGTLVWWGYVHEVTLDIGNLKLVKSLERLANKLAIKYSYVDAAGVSQSGTTDWASDTPSIAQYGTRERILSVSGADQTAATAYRTRKLAALRDPVLITEPSSGKAEIELTCKGYWNKLEWTRYSQTQGYDGYEENVNVWLAVKAYYQAATITFEASNNILDSAYNLRWAQDAEYIYVAGSGTSGNNGKKAVEGVSREQGADRINIRTNDVTTDSGETITLYRGEEPSQKVAQSFQVTTGGWIVNSLAVQLRKVRSPIDNVKLTLCSDSAGSPGTVLETVNVAASTLSEEAEWITFTLAGTTTLAGSTTYWIVLERSGSASTWDFFEVGLSNVAGYASGVCKIYNGSAWVATAVAYDMSFRLFGNAETTDQMGRIITANGNFAGSAVFKASGIFTPLYREAKVTSKTEFEKLMALGATGDIRLVAQVDKDRRVTIGQIDSTTRWRYVARTGELVAKGGEVPIPPGVLLYNEYLELDIGNWNINLPSPVFVEASEYTAASNRISWEIGDPLLKIEMEDD